MKNFLVTTLAVLGLSIGLQAQHETIFNNARVVGAFGGPMWEYGISNDLGSSFGGGGAVVINSFFIGGYGLGSIDFEELLDEGDVDVLDIGHGGLWLGGTYQPHRLIHLYGSTRIGWGAINVDFDDPNVRFSNVDQIFVLTPEVGLEVNFTRWFRIAGTVGYRWVNGTSDARSYDDGDFSGLVGGLTLRFGWFGNRRDY